MIVAYFIGPPVRRTAHRLLPFNDNGY